MSETPKNLGFVKAIHVGTIAPANTIMIWFDTTTSQGVHKVYNPVTSSWQPIFSLVSTDVPTETADSRGQTWEIRADSEYIYVKTEDGWKRTALSTFS